jgi:hypothetical protein
VVLITLGLKQKLCAALEERNNNVSFSTASL